MKNMTEQEAARLPGRVEVIADKRCSKSAAISRCKNVNPKGLLPGGTPFVVELEDKELTASGRWVTRFLACWHAAQGPN